MDYIKLQKLLKSRDKRRCSYCGRMKHYRDFGFVQYELGKYKFRSPCKECQNKIRKESDYNYLYKFKKYGITYIDYKEMISNQGGTCLICGKQDNLFIDHCHKTNKIRGLLCSECNSLLGFCYDNIEILENAILYLKNKTL